jgi:hypothetical protein
MEDVIDYFSYPLSSVPIDAIKEGMEVVNVCNNTFCGTEEGSIGFVTKITLEGSGFVDSLINIEWNDGSKSASWHYQLVDVIVL